MYQLVSQKNVLQYFDDSTLSNKNDIIKQPPKQIPENPQKSLNNQLHLNALKIHGNRKKNREIRLVGNRVIMMWLSPPPHLLKEYTCTNSLLLCSFQHDLLLANKLLWASIHTQPGKCSLVSAHGSQGQRKHLPYGSDATGSSSARSRIIWNKSCKLEAIRQKSVFCHNLVFGLSWTAVT